VTLTALLEKPAFFFFQSLKAKIPALVDKVIAVSTLASKTGPASAEKFNDLLKRPWDPAAGSQRQHKPVSTIIHGK
jgi:hypothetical protein